RHEAPCCFLWLRSRLGLTTLTAIAPLVIALRIVAMARKNPADCGTVGPLTDVLRRLRTAPRLRQTAVFDPDRSWVALKSRTAAVSSVLRCAILPVGSTRHWAVKRREFITLLGGAAVWPLAARALQGKLPTIGFLGSGTAATQSQWTGAFVQRLRELGW